MCGICGIVNPGGPAVDQEVLMRMTSALSRRGPDGGDVYLSGKAPWSVGLGHRRLSIIDLSDAGRQPMTNEDRTLWLVFNGEIYNFQILRKELENKGHRFRSRTDSEVIIHLYEEEGTGGIGKLAGMFAFALWDENAQTLLLCRDRIGIKPLLYYQDDHRFIFGSEIKAILQDPDAVKEVDWDALGLYLTLNYIPAPYTIFRNIRKLRPGHFLLFKAGVLKESPYWDIERKEDRRQPGKDYETQKQELFSAIEGAVRSHLISDVPLGAFLSGGIDSSLIVGLMARNSDRPVKTYSIGYRDMPLYDETAYAREVAVFNGTDHHEILLQSQDILDAVPMVLESLDEPFADSSAVPTFIVSRETSREVKVALSGDGGDELFAGYRMYTGEYWYSRYRLFPAPVRRLFESALSLLPDSRDSLALDVLRRAKKFTGGAKDSLEERFYAWNEIFSRDLRESLFVHSNGADSDLGRRRLAARLGELEGDPVNRMLYADLKESLPGDMLHKVDAMSMLNSLEVRVPLLDHRVCELAFSIEGDRKIRRGRGKSILIDAFRDILPPSLHHRPKRGFEIPLSIWLKKDLKYLIDEYLSRDTVVRQGIFNHEVIKRLTAQLLSRRSDTSWQLWNLIVFQAWHAGYFNG